MYVSILFGLILLAFVAFLYTRATQFLKLPVFGMDKDLIVINKAIAVLIIVALALGFIILAIGLLNLGFHKEVGPTLTIAGTILFSLALIGVILFSNRLKQ